MPRRYRRRRYAISRPLKTAKYSNETYTVCQSMTATGGSHFQKGFPVVPDTAVLATRKCKNFTLKIGLIDVSHTPPGGDPAAANPIFYWALVFVPQGNEPSTINVSATNADSAISLYEPNQNVIMSGVITDINLHTYKTRLARNLNSGDLIALVVRCENPYAEGDTSYDWASTINYAISY